MIGEVSKPIHSPFYISLPQCGRNRQLSAKPLGYRINIEGRGLHPVSRIHAANHHCADRIGNKVCSVGRDQISGGLLDKSLTAGEFTDDCAAENGVFIRQRSEGCVPKPSLNRLFRGKVVIRANGIRVIDRHHAQHRLAHDSELF